MLNANEMVELVKNLGLRYDFWVFNEYHYRVLVSKDGSVGVEIDRNSLRYENDYHVSIDYEMEPQLVDHPEPYNKVLYECKLVSSEDEIKTLLKNVLL